MECFVGFPSLDMEWVHPSLRSSWVCAMWFEVNAIRTNNRKQEDCHLLSTFMCHALCPPLYLDYLI